VLTVFLARLWFGEVTVGRQWAGLAVGLVGVYLVLAHKVSLKGMDWIDTLAITLALAAISIGTLYQKRYCAHVDLRIGAVVQFGACFVLYSWPA
jgi:drug/metabolite transporter (DMT)-like permease